jgi:hypothetical protein
MPFPASPSNNDVHKVGNRSFVYDSALGTWDQVRETDRTENNLTVTGTLGSEVTFPEGHIIKTYHRLDTNNGSYGSAQHPLGGASGLRCPVNGNITTSIANSKFLIIGQVSSSWGGTHSGSHSNIATDWGLYFQRNNVAGTSTTRVGGGTNDSHRGGANTWYGNDDALRGYNPLDMRCFMMTHLDSPNAAAGTTLYYSVGVNGDMSTAFPYNRTGVGTNNGRSASTLIVYEIAP